MLDEQMYISELYDYYQSLLTDKQKEYFEDYYFENLTIQEIADENGVSKNAVSKSLIETKEKLEEYEKNLKLYNNKQKIISILDTNALESIIDFI